MIDRSPVGQAWFERCFNFPILDEIFDSFDETARFVIHRFCCHKCQLLESTNRLSS